MRPLLLVARVLRAQGEDVEHRSEQDGDNEDMDEEDDQAASPSQRSGSFVEDALIRALQSPRVGQALAEAVSPYLSQPRGGASPVTPRGRGRPRLVGATSSSSSASVASDATSVSASDMAACKQAVDELMQTTTVCVINAALLLRSICLCLSRPDTGFAVPMQFDPETYQLEAIVRKNNPNKHNPKVLLSACRHVVRRSKSALAASVKEAAVQLYPESHTVSVCRLTLYICLLGFVCSSQLGCYSEIQQYTFYIARCAFHELRLAFQSIPFSCFKYRCALLIMLMSTVLAFLDHFLFVCVVPQATCCSRQLSVRRRQSPAFLQRNLSGVVVAGARHQHRHHSTRGGLCSLQTGAAVGQSALG